MRSTIATSYMNRNVIIERATLDGFFISYLNAERTICRMRFIPLEHVISVTPAPKAQPARAARVIDTERAAMLISYAYAAEARANRDYGMARYWLKSMRFERGLANRLPA